jgi:hypothetical protein
MSDSGGLSVLHRVFAAAPLELSATADDMSPFSKDLWPEGDGAVFRYDPERRFEIRCELEAAFFHLYLGSHDEWARTASPELLKALPTPRDAVAYIMGTFPIVKRKDEAAHGSYRTKERILTLYDELARCLAEGREFTSTLNPPPGPPRPPRPPSPPRPPREGGGERHRTNTHDRIVRSWRTSRKHDATKRINVTICRYGVGQLFT